MYIKLEIEYPMPLYLELGPELCTVVNKNVLMTG